MSFSTTQGDSDVAVHILETPVEVICDNAKSFPRIIGGVSSDRPLIGWSRLTADDHSDSPASRKRSNLRQEHFNRAISEYLLSRGGSVCLTHMIWGSGVELFLWNGRVQHDVHAEDASTEAPVEILDEMLERFGDRFSPLTSVSGAGATSSAPGVDPSTVRARLVYYTIEPSGANADHSRARYDDSEEDAFSSKTHVTSAYTNWATTKIWHGRPGCSVLCPGRPIEELFPCTLPSDDRSMCIERGRRAPAWQDNLEHSLAGSYAVRPGEAWPVHSFGDSDVKLKSRSRST